MVFTLKYSNIITYFVFLTIYSCIGQDSTRRKSVVIELKEDALLKQYKVHQYPSDTLTIFCYAGKKVKRIKRIFSSITFQLFIDGTGHKLYKGENEDDINKQYRSYSLSRYDFIPWKTQLIGLEIYKRSCIGVSTKQEYHVKLDIKVYDPWLVGFMITGCLIFFNARRLSRNAVSFYTGGVSLGLLGSTLLFVIIIYKLSRSWGTYAIIAVGCTIGVYFMETIREVIQHVKDYSVYVLGYFISAGVISFLVCYFYGPPTEERKLRTIQWTLQIIGLICIYKGTSMQETSLSIIVVVILMHILPSFIVRKCIAILVIATALIVASGKVELWLSNYDTLIDYVSTNADKLERLIFMFLNGQNVSKGIEE